jgi:hypothetical protein
MQVKYTTINKENGTLYLPLSELIGITIISVMVFASTSLSHYVLASESEPEPEPDSLSSVIKNFTQNLEDEISQYVSEAISTSNSNLVNLSSPRLPNGSNIVSSQVVNSNNNSVVSFTNSTAGNGSVITNQITNRNGVCTSNIVGGLFNETLSSNGTCNDQLTGGGGSDRFICGEGTDTIRDFNADEGDIIVDPKNCETTS